MRDITFKSTTLRTAVARAELKVSLTTLDILWRGEVPKGDPLPVAKVAAVMAAKKTTEWIPYCHNIPIEHVDVAFEVKENLIVVLVTVSSVAKTGVEMEALTAASAAVLTLYDMLKMLDEEMEIGTIRLLEKSGGKSDMATVSGWSGAVLTVSDRASEGIYEDRSGPILQAGMKKHGATRVHSSIVGDDPQAISATLREWIDAKVPLIFITGGTGLGPRDFTTEVVEELIEKRLDAVSQEFLRYGQSRKRTAYLSRSVSGVSGSSIIVSLPGSPGACEDAVNCLFPSLLHALEMLDGKGHP